MYELIVENARLYPMAGDGSLSPMRAMGISAGKIVELAEASSGLAQPARRVFDAGNRIVLPGFVDCHTHAVFAGDRMAEYLLRLQGKSYEEIARAGGGISSTVSAVRAASLAELVTASRPRLEALMAEGVTSVEIKSGYGLDLDNEVKMLHACRKLGEQLALDISATFLGAHAIPPGRDKGAYLEEVIEVMLPAVASESLAGTVDIYVESIAFDTEDLRKLAAAAETFGLGLRVHSDQLSNMGATAVAAELGALSCDHLEYSNEQDVAALAASGTIAVLLPGAFYFLRETRKPPVARFRAAGVPMAVATDLNPGTSPIASLLTCLHFSTALFGLTEEEALLGVTSNAARALGRGRQVGSLEPGKMANFCVWDLPEPGYLCYQLGGLTPDVVFYEGRKR